MSNQQIIREMRDENRAIKNLLLHYINPNSPGKMTLSCHFYIFACLPSFLEKYFLFNSKKKIFLVEPYYFFSGKLIEIFSSWSAKFSSRYWICRITRKEENSTTKIHFIF